MYDVQEGDIFHIWTNLFWWQGLSPTHFRNLVYQVPNGYHRPNSLFQAIGISGLLLTNNWQQHSGQYIFNTLSRFFFIPSLFSLHHVLFWKQICSKQKTYLKLFGAPKILDLFLVHFGHFGTKLHPFLIWGRWASAPSVASLGFHYYLRMDLWVGVGLVIFQYIIQSVQLNLPTWTMLDKSNCKFFSPKM